MWYSAVGCIVTLTLSLLATPLTAAAPPPGKMPRIGVLALGSPPISPDWKARSPFFQELRKLGWLEGQNIVLEYRWAEGQASRLSPLAAELVRLPVDVIVVADTPAIRTAQQATTTIPIVMVSVGDPVGTGIRRRPRAAGWQHHRGRRHGARVKRQTAGAPQRGGSRGHTDGDPCRFG